MKLKLDKNKKYGLVLEGGGAKGAYQIGAWRALKEAGIQIKGISGSSVGTLNGALICMDDLEKAERIWKSISYTKVMDIEEGLMEGLLKRDFSNLSVTEVLKSTVHYLIEGGFDATPLRNLIQNNIREEKLISKNPEFYFQTFSVTDKKELEIDASEVPKEDIVDMILASAYFPAFKAEKIHGNKFIDGGMFNNVPIDALIKRGYQDIIVIRIYGIGVEKKVEIPEDVTVVEIAPRVELGNMLEFERKKSIQNMKIGYFDALRVLYGLEGNIYYINSQLEERECVKRFLNPFFSLEEVCRDYKIEEWKQIGRERTVFEFLLPKIAEELKLEKDWNYYKLYLAILEASARLLHIPKYEVYTEEELLLKIIKKWNQRKREGERKKEEFPGFIKYVAEMK